MYNRNRNTKENNSKKFVRKPVQKAESKSSVQNPVAKKTKASFEDLKNQLSAWVSTEKIPGKVQAWFTDKAETGFADWRILKVVNGNSERFTIESPSSELEKPEVVSKVFEQLKKEHLKIFCKALRQIWFRGVGDNQFAVLIQANLKGRNSAHGYKTFVEYLERTAPEICSCHHVQCTPDYLFDPTASVNMKVEAKAAYGNDFMPIGESGSVMHVLDWSPRIRDVWQNLPQRIESAIHPSADDSFFEFYSGSSFVSSALSGRFQRVDSMDCRDYAMLSSRLNARNSINENVHFHRGHVEASFFNKFFSKKENEAKWTFYLNLPENESLAQGMEQAVAGARPERILLQTASLDIAAKEIKKFRNEGYMLRKSIPLYLEPGSGKFELLMIFVPDRVGILGNNISLKGRTHSVKRPQERVLGRGFAENKQEQPHFSKEVPSFKQRKG